MAELNSARGIFASAAAERGRLLELVGNYKVGVILHDCPNLTRAQA